MQYAPVSISNIRDCTKTDITNVLFNQFEKIASSSMFYTVCLVYPRYCEDLLEVN